MNRIFPRNTQPEVIVRAVATMVAQIDTSKSWVISVELWRKPRSNAQNNYLNGVIYPMILEAGGEALRGWHRADLHEFFLGECWGWERIEGLNHRRMRPLKRSSKLTQAEFTEFLHFIENKCIELGIGPFPEPIYREEK